MLSFGIHERVGATDYAPLVAGVAPLPPAGIDQGDNGLPRYMLHFFKLAAGEIPRGKGIDLIGKRYKSGGAEFMQPMLHPRALQDDGGKRFGLPR